MRCELLLVACLAAAIGGCIAFDGPGTITIRLLITLDAGTVVLDDEVVRLPEGSTALDALDDVAVVEASYGGGFVTSIDGRRSRYPDERVDWFYHINGALANVGSAERPLVAGDVVLWDHRPWNRTLALPFVLTGSAERLDPLLLGTPRPPAALQEHTAADALFARVRGDELIVLDAWGVASERLAPPWLLVHVVPGGSTEPAFLVVASDPSAHRFVDAVTEWTPAGVGVVVHSTGMTGVPS